MSISSMPMKTYSLLVQLLSQKLRHVFHWMRHHWIIASALVCIALPSVLASIYLGLFASDRFAVEFRLALRGQDNQIVDPLGMLSGLTGASQLGSESYIVIDYIRSRAMIDALSKTLDIRKMYSKPSIDWFSRFDPDDSAEKLLLYWNKMLNASYEPSTGIIKIEAVAYDRKEALELAKSISTNAEALVNRLSEDSRNDALKAAIIELGRAEQRQRSLRASMREFREKEQISDPAKRAGAQQELIEKARAELSRNETELQTARGYMKDDSPAIAVLKNQRAALTKQLESLQRDIGGGAMFAVNSGQGDNLSAVASMLSTYEELEGERAFAEKAYLAAQSSLERARIEADRKHRYLAMFVPPSLPEDAKYPMRVQGVVLTIVVCSVLWSLGLLVVFGIRDHL